MRTRFNDKINAKTTKSLKNQDKGRKSLTFNDIIQVMTDIKDSTDRKLCELSEMCSGKKNE